MARICAVADVFDALSTERPYRQALSVEETCDYLRRAAGSHLDPRLVDLFLQTLPSLFGVKIPEEQHTGSVLIVEDDPDVGSLMDLILRQKGHRTRLVDSGEAALDACERYPPDLVLLDLTLPSMDGFAVARSLQAHPRTREIPFIFISSSGDVQQKVVGLCLGASDYIDKPFHRDELLARVEVAP